jgi:hypothetical protein
MAEPQNPVLPEKQNHFLEAHKLHRLKLKYNYETFMSENLS